MLTLFKRDFTIGRRITLVIFNLVIIAKLKCDNLYNINDKIITLCYASANFILLKNKKKLDFIELFRVVRVTVTSGLNTEQTAYDSKFDSKFWVSS